MHSHPEKTRLDMMPSDRAFAGFGDEGEGDLGLLIALGEVAQVVQETVKPEREHRSPRV